MELDPVAVLRRFNRTFTPRIGVLDESFLGTGRPLAAARMLFEIGLHDGVAVQMLREKLGSDSGYVSRLLRNLEGDGLIELQEDPADGRRRVAHLTERGRAEWDELDRRSDDIAHELLDAFTPAQAGRLAGALDQAQRLLRCASIEARVVPPSSRSAETARRRYFEELHDRFRDGFAASDDSPAERDRMAAPHGAFLVLEDGAEIVGCGGVYRVGEDTAEIKRMWLDRSLRGLGMGRRLLSELESSARDLGCLEVVLDTNEVLTEAIAMYRSAGYRPTERYNDNPYAHLWFRKTLD